MEEKKTFLTFLKDKKNIIIIILTIALFVFVGLYGSSNSKSTNNTKQVEPEK